MIELTDFIMPDEEKLLSSSADIQNPAGLTADGYSAGVMLETGAPVITGVRGIFSHDMVLLDWEVDLSKSVSPVDHYDVALVRAEDLNSSPAGWKWEKTVERRYERRIHELPEGGYYLVIRGYNKAGVASRRELGEWGISELLIIDYTPRRSWPLTMTTLSLEPSTLKSRLMTTFPGSAPTSMHWGASWTIPHIRAAGLTWQAGINALLLISRLIRKEFRTVPKFTWPPGPVIGQACGPR